MDPAIIQASFARIQTHDNKEIAQYFYFDALFKDHDELRPMFPANMTAQQDRLMKAITRIAQNLGNPDKLKPFLRNLGRSHMYKYGVWPWHYEWVGEALIQTLAHFDPEWTDEVGTHWSEGYMFCVQEMKNGASNYSKDDPIGAIPLAVGTQKEGIGINSESMGMVRFPTQLIKGYNRRSVDEFLSLAWGAISQLEEDNRTKANTIAELETRNRELSDVYRARSDTAHIAREIQQERAWNNGRHSN